MKYMLLIHHGTAPTPYDPEAWGALPEAERARIGAAYQEINATPGVTPGLQLQPAHTATTVRVTDGRALVTDGPYVALKEAIGGFLVVEAEDIDAAIAVAAKVPSAAMGGAVEIRPIVEW